MADEPRDWEQLSAAALAAVNEILDDTPLAERVTDAILSVLNEETVNRLGAEFIADTKLKAMDFRNGGRMELEPARDVVALWVGAARGLLEESGAENYAEIEMTFGVGEDPQKYAFWVQRVGKLTPHQARRQAEVERDALSDLLASIWLYTNWRYVTRQLTTRQKNLWADAVDAASDEETNPDGHPVADRWWEDSDGS